MSVARKSVVLCLGLFVIAGTAVLAIRGIDQAAVGLQRATVLPQPMPLPDFHLVDQNGSAFTTESLLGRQSLLFFGFTHCPDICPATLQQLAVARHRLSELGTADEALPDIILISVDPERDSPSVLRDYTAHFGSGVKGLSGDDNELQVLTRALGIYYARDDYGSENHGSDNHAGNHAAGPGYNVNHSAAVLVINADAEFQAVFNAPIEIEALVADLQILSKAR